MLTDWLQRNILPLKAGDIFGNKRTIMVMEQAVVSNHHQFPSALPVPRREACPGLSALRDSLQDSLLPGRTMAVFWLTSEQIRFPAENQLCQCTVSHFKKSRRPSGKMYSRLLV